MLQATIEGFETKLYCATWWSPEVSVVELVMKSVVSLMDECCMLYGQLKRFKQHCFVLIHLRESPTPHNTFFVKYVENLFDRSLTDFRKQRGRASAKVTGVPMAHPERNGV